MTYNSESEIGPCLDALAHKAQEVIAIVVDNSSADRTVEIVKRREGARLIQNGENRGFAAAVNQGVQACPEADCILLLNPDARILTGVEKLIAATISFGLSSGKLLDENGLAQSGFTIRRFPSAATLVLEALGINRLWPSNSVNRHYRYLDRDLNQPGEVEQPAGAFLMFRRDVWSELGGFDERFYPVWFEDVDFCRRAIDSRHRVYYVPEVSAQHLGGRSVATVPSGSRAVFWYVSLLRYASKHFSPGDFRAVCASVVLGSIPRMVAGIILERSLKPVGTYLKVIWVSLRSLVTAREPDPLPAT